MEAVRITTTNFRGGMFDRFFVRRDQGFGPGWYVFGRNPAYGDSYVKRCAQPDVKPRRHRHYNCRVMPGWERKRDAQRWADILNQRSADCAGLMMSVPLHGARFFEDERGIGGLGRAA